MKVKNLTKETINQLQAGDYAVFDKNGLIREVINVYYNPRNEPVFSFITVQGWWNLNLEEFKEDTGFENCEIFPVEQVKKPTI